MYIQVVYCSVKQGATETELAADSNLSSPQPLLPAADFLNEFKVDLKNNNDQLTTAADFQRIQRGIKK